MTTIKSYTDINQSKKLAEILPIESADMCWVSNGLGKPFARTIPIKGDPEELCGCWSLDRLIDIIPYAIHISDNKFYRLGTDKGYNDYAIWYEDNGCTVNTLDVTANNFIDACYEMIIKLHEQKML